MTDTVQMICFDCDRRIKRRGRKLVTAVGDPTVVCEGREGVRGHRTEEMVVRAERIAAARATTTINVTGGQL